MRRAGSRYGLPATNRSLKHAMEDFQDLKGCLGYIRIPETTVQLSLKKQARWKWIDEKTPDPSWALQEDVRWLEIYTVRGTQSGRKPPDTGVIEVEYLGRSEGVSHKDAVAKCGEVGTLEDHRHKAYLASSCCGCSFCSDKPRWRARKKTKGRRKHSHTVEREE